MNGNSLLMSTIQHNLAITCTNSKLIRTNLHNCKTSFVLIHTNRRSEGFSLAAYFIPGRGGRGAWPDSKIVSAAPASETLEEGET